MAYLIFKEKQQLNPIWVWIWIVLVFIVVFLLAVNYSKLEASLANESELIGLIIRFAFVPIVPTLFFMLRLETRIDEKGIRYRYFPLIPSWRKVALQDIKGLQLIRIKYFPGIISTRIRYQSGRWMYKINGRYGIRVTLDKKEFIIGTQNPKEAKKAIDQLLQLKTKSNVH